MPTLGSWRSLRMRLGALCALSLVACAAVGVLLLALWQETSRAQIGRAEAVIAHACDLIADRWRFYSTSWAGPGSESLDPGTRADLAGLVGVALARQTGVEGGIWQSGAGPLAYAFPTY